MKRRTFIQAASITASLAVTSLAGAQSPTTKRPNVILVITDDQGYGDLACLGNPLIKTPNMDTLHAESVRLTNYHVSPTCSPTRASLLTGRYSNRVGVWHTVMGRSQLRADETTMADIFQRNGYATGHFGKWHLGDNYPFRPMDRGFETAVWHGGGGIGNTQDYWGNDYFDDWYSHNGEWREHKGYCSDEWFNEARAFVSEKSKAAAPFFCYVSTNAPHHPFRVPEKYAKPYREVLHQDEVNENEEGLAEFYGMITNIDENLGKLMRDVDSLGIGNDTIFIFTTDNGTAASDDEGPFYNASMREQKGSMYDGGHRVPFFLRWPGSIDGGQDVDTLTAHIDILPTLAELCDLRPGEHLPWDGVDLSALLSEEAGEWPDRVIISDSQRLEDLVKWRRCSVMTNRWRLVNGEELYEIGKDPAQENDVSQQHPDVVRHLRDEYEKWWADTSERSHEYTRTIIGSEFENPVLLTSHDWHTEAAQSAWNQNQIRRGPATRGFWEVLIAKPGTYKFTLRRWPKESPENSLNTDKITTRFASIAIGSVYESSVVSEGASEVDFKIDLEAGPAKIVTTLAESEEKEAELNMGAYYLYAERLEEG